MEIFLSLTKTYIKDRSKHIEDHWYKRFKIIKILNPIPNKRIDACAELANGDLNFSFKVKNWLHSQIEENSLTIEDLRDWITHNKTHIIKLKERTYFLLIMVAILVFLVSVLADAFLRLELFLIVILIGSERVINFSNQSSLNELIIYLEREIQSME